ncbi:hypothetical protein ACN2XU_21500 [Primorskyibacter sp. 2E107]|uniref:hypothetical protein n=1 Tax=Primorskyibacter sp. 2E107 TaxID=3403458 RepID=UPI003AF7E97E
MEPPTIGPDGLPDGAGRMMQWSMATGRRWEIEILAPPDAMAGFLESHVDPSLWIQVVCGMNYDLDVSFDCLQVMLRHPACQNAVATALLQIMEAQRFFGSDGARIGRSNPSAFGVLETVCRRDAMVGFPDSGARGPAWVDRETLKREVLTKSMEVTAPFPPPFKLLSAVPTGPVPRAPYLVDEGGIGVLRWTD